MSKFITGKDLEEAIYDIIWDAEQTLLIFSPYIKLDDYFKKLFDKHKSKPGTHVIIVFGKNENEIHKSLSKQDFDYFKSFPNISIIYVPKLHAKYYGNEKKGVVTSINMYDYSFKNNIEYGIYTEQTVFNQFGTNIDNDIWNTSIKIAEDNNAVFIKRPVYENKKFIINLSKNYVESRVLHDSTNYFYEKTGSLAKALMYDFKNELDIEEILSHKPTREEIERKQTPSYGRERSSKHGFCIRTGQQIPFNPNQPMSKDAWRVWNEFKNYDFGEKFCHKTGKPSYGKTSMRNPILYN